jgi:prophage antirepressor-like protein
MTNIIETLDKNYIKFEKHKIGVLIDNNDTIWFNAHDTGEALGYLTIKDTIKKYVDKEEKIQLHKINTDRIIDKHPHSVYLNESGLYNLILQSRLPKAKSFKLWLTKEVLPSIRKYGFYKQKKKYEKNMDSLMEKINYLEKKTKKMNNDLKKEKYPCGGIVYVIDYSDETDNIFRIGMTNNMNKRKKIYDTHTLHKHNVSIIEQIDCPLQFEACVRSLLYKFRYKNKKDFYICKLTQIRKAFNRCKKDITCMNQKGGSVLDNEINDLKKKKLLLEKKIVKVNKVIETTNT